MDKDVFISIVVGCFNQGDFLAQAIESCLCQSYRNFELIIIDDGSSDSSVEVARRYLDRAVVIEKPNGGQRSLYNLGLSRASGEVIIFLDADDVLDRDALLEISKEFQYDCVKVQFQLQIIDKSGTPMSGVTPSVLSDGDVRVPLISSGLLYYSSPGSGNAYLVSALRRLPALPTSSVDRHGADFFFSFGIVVYGAVRSIRKPLAMYRLNVAKEDADYSVTFGNAKAPSAKAQHDLRCREFAAWIKEGTKGEVNLPNNLRWLPVSKLIYGAAIFDWKRGASGGSEWISALRELFAVCLQDPWRQPSAKIAILGWAVCVLLAPRVLTRYLVAKGCNQASR